MILITGATGTVGSRLVQLLLEEDAEVRVLARDPVAARARLGRGVQITEGDFGEPGSLRRALAGIERLFLLTTRARERGGQLEHERNVIEAARGAGVEHVVKQSVLGADEASPISFARSHREAEKALEASGLQHTVLRAAAFMQNFLEMVSDGKIYTCAGDGAEAMVDTRDIAAAAAAVLCDSDPAGGSYSLTGPAMVSYDEAATTLSAVAGQRIEHVRVPPEAVIEGMTGAGLPQWFAEDMAAKYREFDAGRGEPPSAGVKQLTGRAPRSLEDFAREEFAYEG